MFKLFNSSNHQTTIAMKSTSYYIFADVGNFNSMSVYYDHPQEFQANLHVLITANRFSSLNFCYHAKNDFGSVHTFLFTLVSHQENELQLYCTNIVDKEVTFAISNCNAELNILKANILDALNNRKKSMKQMENSITDHTKELLQNFTKITTQTLSENPNASSFTKIIELFGLESKKFKDCMEMEEKLNTIMITN